MSDPQPSKLQLVLRARYDRDRIIVVSINGRIYNYLVTDGNFDEVARRVQFYIRKGWHGRALSWLKKQALVYDGTR